MLILIQCAAICQDIHFSQFYANPMYLNAALTANNDQKSYNMAYRNQWPGVGKAYQTFLVGYQTPLKSGRSGFGVGFTHDIAGSGNLGTSALRCSYSQHFKLTRKLHLNMGASVSGVQKSVNWESLVFGDMLDARKGQIYDTRQPFGEPRFYADFSTGFVLYTKSYYVGFAADHLTQPYEGLITRQSSYLPRKYTIHAGGNIAIDKMHKRDLSVSPALLIQAQNEFWQVNVGSYVKMKQLVFGGWYRWNDAVILNFGVEVGEYQFGYSYDFTVNGLRSSFGGHEITLKRVFAKKYKRPNFLKVDCPVF